MDKRFIFKFASRNLMTHRLRSLLTVVGITIGISAIVFLVAFATGVERLVTGEVTRGDAFKLVDVGSSNVQAVKLNQDAITNIKAIDGVQDVQLVVNLAAKGKKDTDNLIDVTFNGTTDKYIEWSGFSEKWGTSLGEAKKTQTRPIVINTAYATFLNAGDPSILLGKKTTLDVVLPRELTGDGVKKVENAEFVIAGIISDNSTPIVYVDYTDPALDGLQSYSQFKIETKTTDKAKIDIIRKQIENMGLKTQYVGDTVTQIEQVFSVFKVILGSFGFIALVVAALGMFNTLTISLLERTKEVALMKILGMRSKDVMIIFLTEALALGFFGGLLGVIFGIGLGEIANSIFNHYAILAGGEKVAVFYFPVVFIALIWFFSVAVSFLTGLYPARRATKVDALDVLRYE